MPYGGNNGTSQYALGGQGSSSEGLDLTVLSCQPAAGTHGTKLMIKVSAQYDVYSISMTPYASIIFGSHRVRAQLMKDASSNGATAFTYTISANVPQFMATSWASPNNVPLTLVIECGGEEVARVDNAGLFTYHDAHSGSVEGGAAGVSVESSGDASPHDGGMRGSSQSQGQSPEQQQQQQQQQRPNPLQQNLSIRTEAAANAGPLNSQQASPVDQSAPSAYGYPSNDNGGHTEAQADTNFAGVNGEANQDNGSMLGAYRTTGYGHYSRAPPAAVRSRRGSGWTTSYSSHYEAIHGPSVVSRPSMTPISQHNGHDPAVPTLQRTSTLNTSHGSSGVGGYNNPYAVFPAKASLEISGDLSTMSEKWTPEEWENRRRIVLFKKTQQGSQLKISFRPVPVNERPPNSILVSCIWWAEKNECFVTSVDTIHLLEQLLAGPPSRFSVEEKNRIRRNLEGLHPITVSKSKAESEEFFKLIMAFGTPKPRNIEKDVKVFPWRILDQALRKIISKYSAPPPTQQQQYAIPAPLPMLTTSTSGLGGSYSSHGLPPTPVSSGTGPADHTAATGYMGHNGQYHGHGGHGEPIPSPRSLSGHSTSSTWLSHPTAPNRTVSPGMRVHSPAATSNMRQSTLPAIYDHRAANQPLTSPYGMPTNSGSHYHHAPQHQSQTSYGQTVMPVQANQPRTWDGRIWDATAGQRNMDGRSWEGYSGVTDSYASHTSHNVHSGQPPVYGPGAYGDSAQRLPREL